LKKLIAFLGCAFLVLGLVIACAPAPAPPAPAPPAPPAPAPPAPPAPPGPVAPFKGLADIPEITNKRPIHVGLEYGGSAEAQLPLLKKFTEKTGVPVTYESMLMAVVYPKVMPELIGGTGAFDATTTETTWTNEWDPYIYSLDELAVRFDPGGKASLDQDAAGIGGTQLRCASTWDGRVKGFPYYTYDMFMWIRTDINEDPTEQANFKAKYGYDLKIPETYAELLDQAEFFTRKKGDLLKGVPLEHDFYGYAAMAGNYPHVNDEYVCFFWGYSNWSELKRDATGKPIENVFTKENIAAQIKGAEIYSTLVTKYASPGCKTGFWDYNTSQIAEGYAYSMINYIPLDQWAFTVEQKTPGAKIGLFHCPDGKHGYVGNFYQGVTKASRNPEAAYWIARLFSCYESQTELAENGWASIRSDVYENPKYQAPEWRTKVAARGKVLLETWANYMTPEWVNTLRNFSLKSGGRIYDMEIVPCHKFATGAAPVKEQILFMCNEAKYLEEKFGDTIYTWEPGAEDLLK